MYTKTVTGMTMLGNSMDDEVRIRIQDRRDMILLAEPFRLCFLCKSRLIILKGGGEGDGLGIITVNIVGTEDYYGLFSL